MSGLSKTLLKIISAVLVVYLIVAAIPLVKNYIQNGNLAMSSLAHPATSTPVAASSSLTPAEVTHASSQSSSSGKTRTPTPKTATPTSTVKQTTLSSNSSVADSVPDLTYAINLPVISNEPNYTYQEQEGVPAYIQNFSHADAGCAWMSVAGQVFDKNNTPVTSLVIDVQGILNGNSVDLVGLTGLSTDYGPGGYEIQLANKPVTTSATLTIQVFDLSGKALSDKYTFNTLADCSQNVVIINFAP